MITACEQFLCDNIHIFGLEAVLSNEFNNEAAKMRYLCQVVADVTSHPLFRYIPSELLAQTLSYDCVHLPNEFHRFGPRAGVGK